MTAALGERGLIQVIRNAVARRHAGLRVGVGDDCAVLEPESGALLLATTDLLLEDVHFRRRYASASDVGWKAIAVNLSDIAAMGGRPRWALIALACPSATPVEEIQAFYASGLGLADEHGVAIVGGDTAASPGGWIVNVSVLGTSRQPLLRSTARVGDLVAVTGTLGRSHAGLVMLERGDPGPAVDAAVRIDAVTAHLRPRPRVKEGQWLGEAGLATDLRHVAREGGVGARVHLARLPVGTSTQAIATAVGEDAAVWATSGGEDYELLLTCGPDAFVRLAHGLQTATGTSLTVIGEIVGAAEGVEFLDEQGRAVAVESGFEHFVTGPHRG
jgi:thiamine-monophosphate kinase